MEERMQRLIGALRRTLEEQQSLASGACALADLMQKARLADARFAFDQEYLSLAMDRLLPTVESQAELAFAPHHA